MAKSARLQKVLEIGKQLADLPDRNMESADNAVVKKFFDTMRTNAERRPELVGELEAMGREAVKDIRGTIHQAFFNQPEHASEPGTPLSPTPQLVTESLTGKDIYGRSKDAEKTKEGPELDM
jgi:hypothetical protein